MSQKPDTSLILSEAADGFLPYKVDEADKFISGQSYFFHADCMDSIKNTPNNYYDLCIVDPPYGIKESNKTQSRPVMAKQKNGTRLYVSTARKHQIKDWDSNRPDKEYFDELQRVSKNQIIWGGNYFADLLPPRSGWIVWDKVNPMSGQSDCELAWTSWNKATRQFEFMWNGMIQGRSMMDGRIAQGDKSKNEKRIHPTQKPIALYKWLLKNYAKPNDKILDTHVGSASSLIACEDMGFEYMGFELDKDYFEAASKRIREFKGQLKIF